MKLIDKKELLKTIKNTNAECSGIESQYLIIDFRNNINIYDKWVLVNDDIMLDNIKSKSYIKQFCKELEKMILEHLGK